MNVEERIKDAILHGTQNVLIIGCGGTGKSYLLRQIVREARMCGKKCEATAATGVAAVNINGSTLHHFFGVGLCKGTIEYITGRVKKNNEAKIRITTTDILVIDEISMVGDELFNKLDQVARYFRKSRVPFGGMRLVVSGDFLQLPPIGEEWVFESETWRDLGFKAFFMTEPRRFTDKSFYQTLMRARDGVLSRQDILKITRRVKEYNKFQETESEHLVKPTRMYSLRADVESINHTEMEKLPGTARSYHAIDTFLPVVSTAKLDHYTPRLDYMAPKVLSLKVGAQVMLTWNLNVEEGLCNGTRGVVTDLGAETVTIKTRDDHDLTVERINFPLEDKKAKTSRSQFPLILAFALTIHKCQGSTLDFCVVDLGPDVFAPGQGYVALSRARSWDSLLVSSFTRKSIKADPKALEFVTRLEEEEDEDSDDS